MKNFKVSKKLFVSFGNLMFLLVIVVILSVVNISSITNKLKDFYDVPFQNVKYINEMKAELNDLAKNMLHACVATDKEETENRLNMVYDVFNNMENDLNFIKGNYKAEQSDLNAISQAIASLKTEFESFKQLCSNNEIQSAFAIYGDMRPYFEAIINGIEIVKTDAEENALLNYKSGKSTGTVTITITVIIGIISIIIGIVLALYITHSLIDCINELKNSASLMSKGDFDAPLTYHSKDELGELSHGMRIMTDNIKTVIEETKYILSEMADGNFTARVKSEEAYVGAFTGLLKSIKKLNRNLTDTLGQINQSADQVSNGSKQVSEGAQSLAEGSTEEAGVIEELVASVNDISDKVTKNAEHAKIAEEISENTANIVADGNEQMNLMVEAMNEIHENTNQIQNIVKAIEDISTQTNLLSLNAAIEAARAGEHGKGFAVVADEIRNLANESGKATKNTIELIEKCISAAQNGVATVDKTSEALKKIVTGTEESKDAIKSIMIASDEQSQSLQQVVKGIEQVSSVIQSNSAVSEESAATSQELSGQASLLKELIDKFKLQ